MKTTCTSSIDKIISWINRTWTHPRDKNGDYGIRSLMHIPVGMILGIPIFGWFCWCIFKAYEESEDKWCSDESWKDYNGAQIGACITSLIFTWWFFFELLPRLV